MEDLVGRERPGGVRVGVADPDAALEVLREAGLEVALDGRHLYVAEVTDPAEVTRILATREIWVRELVPDSDLESLFLSLTERETGAPQERER